MPPLVQLPAVHDTFFCRDGPNAKARFCTASEMTSCRRGPDGALPSADQCVYVGVPWSAQVCPPGFVVHPTNSASAGKLPACTPDPADCGDDEYGDTNLKDGAVLFVNGSTAKDGGSGTRADPLKTIASALAKAPTGGSVAVAAGVYNESLVLTRPVTLRGRCAAKVTLLGKPGLPVLWAGALGDGGQVTVQGMRVSGDGLGIDIRPPALASFERLWVKGVRSSAFTVEGKGASVAIAASILEQMAPWPIH